MREVGIGRVLVASLHQGIADILPTRLSFYENWLNAEGLREGTIGLAPLYAVLSFLRREGDAYRIITTRAGEYAAEWTVQSMHSTHRAIIKAAPVWLRRWMLLRLASRLVRNSYKCSRAILHVRRGTASLDLARGDREPVEPLNGERSGQALHLRSGQAGAAPTTRIVPPSRILVMPFENLKREGRIFWLAEASAVLLTDDLNALGANAITRQERQQAFERLQVPPVAALSDATVIRIGQLVGAAQVVVGSLEIENGTLLV